MKFHLFLSLLSLAAATASHAAVTTGALLKLGEAGSLGAGNKPQDSVGGFHMQAEINGAAVTAITTGLAATGSTAALHFNGANQGFYGNAGDMGSPTTGSPPDNFGVETGVRTADVNHEGYDFVFSLTGDTLPNTGPAIHLANGRCSASIPGYDWIGGNPFAAGGGVPAVANQWNRMAIVRITGVFSLYVDGVAHAVTTTAAPLLMNGFHMAVNPGGATYFEGDIDETRVFTFAPGAFNAATDLHATPVPEPGAAAVAALGLLGLAAHHGLPAAIKSAFP